jgi:hypothetical protein
MPRRIFKGSSPLRSRRCRRLKPRRLLYMRRLKVRRRRCRPTSRRVCTRSARHTKCFRLRSTAQWSSSRHSSRGRSSGSQRHAQHRPRQRVGSWQSAWPLRLTARLSSAHSRSQLSQPKCTAAHTRRSQQHGATSNRARTSSSAAAIGTKPTRQPLRPSRRRSGKLSRTRRPTPGALTRCTHSCRRSSLARATRSTTLACAEIS